jgi:hypothetical protein
MGGMKVRREESAATFILKGLLGTILLFVAFGLFCAAIIAAMWLLGIEHLPPGYPVYHPGRG